MLLHIGNFILFALLLLNVVGLTLLTGMWLRHTWVALTSGPLLFCTVFFCIECYRGLGDLSWLLPITTLISFWLIYEVENEGWLSKWEKCPFSVRLWKAALAPTQNPSAYIAFFMTFFYCMGWRYAHPAIDQGTELIADMSNLSAYLSGERIPETDYWFPPYKSTHYYSFQYYGGGLLGRLFHLETGLTYNVSFGLLCSLACTTGIGVIWALTERWWIRILVSFHLMFGGTGVTLFLHFIKRDPYLWDYMRFLGNDTWDPSYSPVAAVVLGYDTISKNQSLPGENLAYSIFLGDYHPVLAGFYLIAYGLLVAILWAKLRVPSLMVLLGASVPWTIVSDTWNLPLLLISLLCFLIYHLGTLFREGAWKQLIIGGMACAFALYPYIQVFTADSPDFNNHGIEWVPFDLESPLLLYILFFLPTISFIFCALLSGEQTLYITGLLWLLLMIFTEKFYNHDIYTGSNVRFNSTLKWWPCVSEAALITLVPMLLDLATRTPLARLNKGIVLVMAIYPATYAFNLLNELYEVQYSSINLLPGISLEYPVGTAPSLNFGKLRGYDYLTATSLTFWEKACQEQGQVIIVTNETLFLQYTMTLPKNLVFVEHPEGESFNRGSAFTLFSGHPCFMGWIGHEDLWRGGANAIRYRFDTLTKIYDGDSIAPTADHAGAWLSTQGADVILWFKQDLDKDTQWDKVDATLKPEYRWHDFITEGNGHRMGFWERSGLSAPPVVVPPPIGPVPPPPPASTGAVTTAN